MLNNMSMMVSDMRALLVAKAVVAIEAALGLCAGGGFAVGPRMKGTASFRVSTVVNFSPLDGAFPCALSET